MAKKKVNTIVLGGEKIFDREWINESVAPVAEAVAELREEVERLTPLTPVQLSILQEMAIAHNKTFIVFLQEAGSTIDWGEGIITQTPKDRRQWFTIMRSSASINVGNVIEVAAIATPIPLSGNCFFYSLDDLERVTLATGRKLPTSVNSMLRLCKAEVVDLTNYNTSQVTDAAAMANGAEITRIIGLESLDLSQCENLTRALSYTSNLYQEDGTLDLSRWGCKRVTTLSGLLVWAPRIKRAILSGWDTRRVPNMGILTCNDDLEYLDLYGWDTRSVETLEKFIFLVAWSPAKLNYVRVSPDFFATRHPIDFANIAYGANYFGFTDISRSESNGWLEMIAETAPTIRAAADWHEDEWQADKLEELDETPRLLTEEHGTWYLNDGVERTIQLTSHLKNAAWAQPYLHTLIEKGYTIA